MPLTVAVVELHYSCGACEGPVTATCHLAGDLEGPDGPYCVWKGLECPDENCGCTNDVIFDTTGDVRIVSARWRPEPIWN